MYLKLNNAYPRENFVVPRNIYNKPLEPCPDSNTEQNGSWMPDKTCTEPGGGVHQICYRNIGTNANQFSKNTGQPDWSTARGNQNHCVCLGAWSLYKKKLDEKIIDTDGSSSRLKCSAIPETIFDPAYVKSFSTWNNMELDQQIVNGVEGIVKECSRKARNASDKKSLMKKYCKLSKSVQALRNRPYYRSHCPSLK